MRIEIDPDVQDGEITIDAVDLWWLLDGQQQEAIIRDNAHWQVIERALEFDLGRKLSTPDFYSSIHKLREKICEDKEFVNDITVSFIKQILEEWAKTERKRQNAVSSFWKLYDEVKDQDISTKTPNIIRKDRKHLRMSAKEIREEIMENFKELLKEL